MSGPVLYFDSCMGCQSARSCRRHQGNPGLRQLSRCFCRSVNLGCTAGKSTHHFAPRSKMADG
jgi:hypothetical protein